MTSLTPNEQKELALTNGVIIRKNKDDKFPPLQEVVAIDHACDICPVRVFCDDNNEFDCQVYGMFSGYYFGFDDALKMASKGSYKLLTEFRSQNALLRAECKAADEFEAEVMSYIAGIGSLAMDTPRRWQRVEKTRQAWQEAKAKRMETEPPF